MPASNTSYTRQISAGSDGSDGTLKPAAGRYHLYVSMACPFAHRTLVVRQLKGLEEAISIDVAHWNKDEKGWRFAKDKDDKLCTEDSVNGKEYIRDIYLADNPKYHGAFSVPLLFDKEEGKIVNNESGDIIKMFNSEFNEFSSSKKAAKIDLYPKERQKAIDSVIQWVNDDLNLGVYKCGFAENQESYDASIKVLFKALDKVENTLKRKRYLLGDDLTLADVRLYTTLIRFDAVYYGLFKCNEKRIVDFHNMDNYLRELYQIDAFGKETTFLDHIKKCYYYSMVDLNPNRIVPSGPVLELKRKHDRKNIGK